MRKIKEMSTGLVYDPLFLRHDTGPGHPECPERLTVSWNYLQKLSWFDRLRQIQPRKAEASWIEAVHSPDYIRHAEDVCKSGGAMLDTPDVGISAESFEVALYAAGSALELADQLMAGKISNGFALIRPPGHHAEKSEAMGFCLFNNIAVLAKYLQKKHKAGKILILDWDVHHGNGTQHIFYEDPSVLYVSLHQYPFYPGTGAWNETGQGRGRGFTLNCPMPAGSGNAEYEEAFRTHILPKIDGFEPEAVLLSAGFDAHAQDPLAGICLTTEFFGWMSERLMEISAKYADGRIISLLEGGYNLNFLPLCIGTHLARLAGENPRSIPVLGGS